MKEYITKRSTPMNYNHKFDDEIKLSKEEEDEYMNEMERI